MSSGLQGPIFFNGILIYGILVIRKTSSGGNKNVDSNVHVGYSRLIGLVLLFVGLQFDFWI